MKKQSSTTKGKPARKGRSITEWEAWVESNTRGTSRRFTNAAVEAFLNALGSPLALKALKLFKSKKHAELLALDIEPQCYQASDWELFRTDYLVTQFLSKAKFLKVDVRPDDEAIRKFVDAEKKCAATNEKFALWPKPQDPLFESEIARITHRAWYWINKVVGEGPSCESFFDMAGWGPGSTLKLRGAEVSGYNKFLSERTATTRLSSFVLGMLHKAYPTWDLASLCVADYCDITTVPKKATSSRTIGIEPGLNTWFQKAIGSWLRGRLRSIAGIDLNTGQRRHAHLAKLASISGLLATVDFSMASDLIAKQVVRFLFSTSEGSKRLLLLMEVCRTPLYKLGKGTPELFEKFSSMGNGFTFELETLIFWALAQASSDICEDSGEVSVYGDDVILPTAVAPAYLRTCEYFGFKPNRQKTFITGHFRESCGAHFFNGVDCKPVYLEEALKHGKETFIFANQVRLCAHRFNNGGGCDSRFLGLWNFVVNNIPESLRKGAPVNAVAPFRLTDRKLKGFMEGSDDETNYFTLGPTIVSSKRVDARVKLLLGFEDSDSNAETSGFTDSALIMNFDEACPSFAREHIYTDVRYSSGERIPCRLSPKGWEGWVVRHFSETPVSMQGDGYALFCHRLKNLSTDKAHGENYELRGRTKTRYSEFVVPQWKDIGPWEGT